MRNVIERVCNSTLEELLVSIGFISLNNYVCFYVFVIRIIIDPKLKEERDISMKKLKINSMWWPKIDGMS